MDKENLLNEYLLMPPPPSKKRSRSITVYSEEEAYARTVTVPGSTSSNSGLHPVHSSVLVCKNTLVTPSPPVLSSGPNDTKPRRAFHSFHPADTCVKSLSSSMTHEFQTIDQSLSEKENQETGLSSSPSNENPKNFETSDSRIMESLPCFDLEKENSVEPSAFLQDETIYRKIESSKAGHDHYDNPTITTRFADIIGHGGAKLRLEETILPLALPSSLTASLLTGLRSAPASILLHGPPGCGKTQLARAVAGEAQAAFISVAPSNVLSKYVGESEASIRDLFRHARERAMKMQSRCAVLFFDEIDALGQSRSGIGDHNNSGSGETSARRILAELLIQLSKNYNLEDMNDDDRIDGNFHREDRMHETIDSNMCATMDRPMITPVDVTELHYDERKPRIIVIAATNRPEDCDPALLRRFHVRILVGLPTKRDRQKIIHHLLRGIENSLTENDLLHIASATHGWSGSDLESLTREAVNTPIRECLHTAAKIKAAARKHNLKSVPKDPSQNYDQNGDGAARDSLLAGFKTLRSVHIQDFEQAMAFWLGDDDFQLLGKTVARKKTHYDSDSSNSSEDTSI